MRIPMCPIYEFQCLSCHDVHEELLSMSEADSIQPACTLCGSSTTRVVSATKGIVRGSHNPVTSQYKAPKDRR